MKQFILLIVFSCCCSFLFAQYSVRLIVTDAATQKGADIYLAGDFNNWNPGDYNFKMKIFGATRKVYVFKDVAAGKFAFKFTRGSWEKVESSAKGEDLENHEVEVSSDTSLSFSIAGWKDDFPDKPKPNTASKQVQILDTAFFMPQLNRYRKVWVYLPVNYNLLKSKSFPVIYMHDGQNLFNEQTAFAGEWGVDECLDTLQRLLNKDCIVVGIDNGGEHRMQEYNPYDDAKFGKGEGSQYVDFLVQTLKPFIDKHYRTQKDPAHTFTAGSSMGGLISLYAVIKYPDVFGAAGVFSPAFQVAPRLYLDAQQMKWKTIHRIFFYAGAKESETMVANMKQMEDALYNSKMIEEQEIIFPLGQHNETYWRQVFDDFYKWLNF